MAPTGYLERVQDWVAENRRTVLVCTAAAAVALTATAYYVSSSSSGPRPKDKKKDKKKKKSANDPDGPILEEIKPKEEDKGNSSFVGRSSLTDVPPDLAPLSLEEIAAMSVEVSTAPRRTHPGW